MIYCLLSLKSDFHLTIFKYLEPLNKTILLFSMCFSYFKKKTGSNGSSLKKKVGNSKRWTGNVLGLQLGEGEGLARDRNQEENHVPERISSFSFFFHAPSRPRRRTHINHVTFQAKMMHCDFATYSKVGLERTRLWWQLLLAFCEYNSVGPLHKKADQVTSASASSIMCKSGYFCLHMRAASKAKNCQGFKHKCGFWKIQLLKSSWQKMSKSRCLQRKETKHIWKKNHSVNWRKVSPSQDVCKSYWLFSFLFSKVNTFAFSLSFSVTGSWYLCGT